jgi:hypothetical protein
MRLQEVLKEREAEISALEASVAQSNMTNQNSATVISNGEATPSTDSADANGGDVFDPSLALSPKTKESFRVLRHSMEVGPNGHSSPSDTGSGSDTDESLARLNELML